ncbi:MAG: hypothetical protein CMQ15_10530 [Gammaproteobacteria bacterium]|nr:hypothetical protein [Gammaproteobacteria bacterium]HJN94966.1 DUF6644 family protein [Gammaproteobacteria bacterium]
MNELLYNFAVWLDTHELSTSLHESYYMYNWVESTHVLTLMLCLGMLFLIDLRMMGLAFPNIPANSFATKLNIPMLVGFGIMVFTGLWLFYAVPVRSSQSVWFRVKMFLLIAAAINAFLFHKNMINATGSWGADIKAPKNLRIGATLSLLFWVSIVICGRFMAYDWFDCEFTEPGLSQFLAGCVDGQTEF